jgi:hypothetical protein
MHVARLREGFDGHACTVRKYSKQMQKINTNAPCLNANKEELHGKCQMNSSST